MPDPDITQQVIEKCQGCSRNGAEPLHECPLKVEVYSNDAQCNCCKDCQYECRMSV